MDISPTLAQQFNDFLYETFVGWMERFNNSCQNGCSASFIVVIDICSGEDVLLELIEASFGIFESTSSVISSEFGMESAIFGFEFLRIAVRFCVSSIELPGISLCVMNLLAIFS